jgi:hypothetical protein
MLTTLLWVLLVPSAWSQERPALPGEATELTAGAELSAASSFTWRGIPVTDRPAVQPEAWLGIANVSLGAWGNIDLVDDHGQQWHELRTFLSVTQAWEELTFVPGLRAYVRPGDGFTAEVVGDFTWQPSIVGLYSDHAIDFWDAKPGWWSETGVLLSPYLRGSLGFDAHLGLSAANRAFNAAHVELDRYGLQYACAAAQLGWYHHSGLYAELAARLDWIIVDRVQQAVGSGPLLGSALVTVGWQGSALWVRGG